MARTTLSPLLYIQAGQEARARREFVQVVTDDDLYITFVSFCEYMKDNYMQKAHYNKYGDDLSQYTSIPLLLENFWLFAGICRPDWDKLNAAVDTAPMCTLIRDAFEAQQIEGAILGVYTAKMVTIIQQRAEKIEHSGGLVIEQITGMQVL